MYCTKCDVFMYVYFWELLSSNMLINSFSFYHFWRPFLFSLVKLTVALLSQKAEDTIYALFESVFYTVTWNIASAATIVVSSSSVKPFCTASRTLSLREYHCRFLSEWRVKDSFINYLYQIFFATRKFQSRYKK